jgi:N-acetylglutamate synthase-like GNAT family acetyltransferase
MIHVRPARLDDAEAISALNARRGVGTALIAVLDAAAREHGAREIRLNVWLFNAETREFYARRGFEVVQERRWRVVPDSVI